MQCMSASPVEAAVGDYHPWVVPVAACRADSRSMTSSTATNLLVGLALICYICAKQLTWRPIALGRLWRLPLVLGAAGVSSMAGHTGSVHPGDVAMLGLSAVLALVSGAVMGRIARLRPSPSDPRLMESRTGWLGVVTWLGLLVVRVALDGAGDRMASGLAASTGTLLLFFALNRAASALVLSARGSRHLREMAGQ